MLKDDIQNILWIGTDGQGIYACTEEEYIFKGINLEELPIKEQRPIRAIHSDHNNDLWLGTKDNGIIRIKDYDNALEFDKRNVEQLTTHDGLSNNAVFAFEMNAKKEVLWIGSNGPDINYYSYRDKKIHTLTNNNPLQFDDVRQILEVSDTILWVASYRRLLKVNIQKNKTGWEAKSIRRYEFNIKNKQIFNHIYSMSLENDSIMWLAMRGNGAIRLNYNNGHYELIEFEKNGIAPMNDILAVHIDEKGNKWFGSSYGINDLKELPDGGFDYRNFNENDGLPNNTIHGILENPDGKLWLSSNAGIILFDPQKETSRSFNQKKGLKVLEFSDNAYHKDDKLPRFFFGGVDGVIWIDYEPKEKNPFIPKVYFTKFRIFNEKYDIEDYTVKDRETSLLKLKHNQSFFTISFSTNDFVNGENGRFSYRLDNFSEVWMLSNNREAQFTNIPPGRYVLNVKYDRVDMEESRIAQLNILILPPWYFGIWAKIIYTIIFISLLVFIYLYITKKYERKKMKIEQQLGQKYKEEMYEGKLRFFTNITHEFCTPLTLIHTPSERILNYEGSDSYVKRYAQTIKTNTEKLNELIQEIIDFRRIETGNKTQKIESCNINEVCTEIVESFSDLAEENHVNFNLNISPLIIWNTDRGSISKILNNLISNAFKYTHENGFINVTVYIENEKLILQVYNTGKGIDKDSIPLIFNRYSVLENVGQNSIKGLSSRNGLGLAICKSMVESLNGEIKVESEVDKYAKFIVKLPAIKLTSTEASRPDVNAEAILPDDFENEKKYLPEKKNEDEDEINPVRTSSNRPSILIVDDNDEMLWLLKDMLSEDYEILLAKDGEQGYNKLINNAPELVITDIMMPKYDGISFTKRIKNNPYTMHIPIVILSAKSSVSNKIEGIESGADAYFTKPFDTHLLKTSIKQLINKKKQLQEYYNSSASAFDFMNGRLLAKEDRDFIQAAVQIVEQNINNIEFSPEDLADNLQISMRSLYRKFKDLELLPPKDFIKDQRIVYAAKLIVSTTLTIQEIMYSVGFSTRSHFYKEFSKRFNQSPKEYRESNNV